MTASDTRLSHADAHARAAQQGWREKVLAYITRRPDELLVFAHTAEYPDAGIQVPAGGVESRGHRSARRIVGSIGSVPATRTRE